MSNITNGIRPLVMAINRAFNGLRSGLTGGYHGADTKHMRAWQDYGYPEQVEFAMHWNMWRRNGLAKRGVQAPVDECWRELPIIVDGDDPDEAIADGMTETQFMRDVRKLDKQVQLFKRLKAGDLRQRVGRYGALIIQVRGTPEQADWSKPLDSARMSQIVRIIPAFEGQLEVGLYDSDPTSERYGQPATYNFNEANVGGRSAEASRSVTIHHSRVITLAEGADDGSIYGIPSLEAGFNALISLEKIVGAAAEGAWKNAAQKLVFKDTLGADGGQLDEPEQKAQDEAITAFVENLDRQLVMGGMDVQNLQSNLADPRPAFEIALNEFAASVNQPSKILIGAQTGRLAADEDGNAWLRYCQSRCENTCSEFVRAVVDRFIALGTIHAPQSGDYTVHWPDLLAPSDGDKFDLADKLAQVNQKMAMSGEVFTPDEVRAIAGYEGQTVLPKLPPGEDLPEEGEGTV